MTVESADTASTEVGNSDSKQFGNDTNSNIQSFRGYENNVNGQEDEDETPLKRLERTISEFNEGSVLSREASRRELERQLEESQDEEDGKPRKPGKGPAPPPRYPFFSPENKHVRSALLKKYLIILVCFWVFILSVWSIYWGSMYQREDRLKNMKILMVVESDEDAILSKALIDTVNDPFMKASADWIVKRNMTAAEVHKTIYDQVYWASFYVAADNVSQQLVDAFQTGTDIDATNFVQCYYATGNDPNGVYDYILPTILAFESYFQKYLMLDTYQPLLRNLTSEQFSNLQNTSLLTSTPIVQYHDSAPISLITMAPLQIGLIYMIIITFFQVMWMGEINGLAAKSITTKDYIIFKMVISQVTYLFVALAFTCLNRAFQIQMNKSWSGGFGVFWMASYLTMSAVGGANDNISLILFAVFPPMMGFWLLFFVICNITATFSPIDVCPDFYRYTYAFPIKNGYEFFKIILFDRTREHLVRYIIILVAWIIINNILYPLCITFFSFMMKRKIQQEAKKEVKELKNDSK